MIKSYVAIFDSWYTQLSVRNYAIGSRCLYLGIFSPILEGASVSIYNWNALVLIECLSIDIYSLQRQASCVKHTMLFCNAKYLIYMTLLSHFNCTVLIYIKHYAIAVIHSYVSIHIHNEHNMGEWINALYFDLLKFVFTLCWSLLTWYKWCCVVHNMSHVHYKPCAWGSDYSVTVTFYIGCLAHYIQQHLLCLIPPLFFFHQKYMIPPHILVCSNVWYIYNNTPQKS